MAGPSTPSEIPSVSPSSSLVTAACHGHQWPAITRFQSPPKPSPFSLQRLQNQEVEPLCPLLHHLSLEPLLAAARLAAGLVEAGQSAAGHDVGSPPRSISEQASATTGSATPSRTLTAHRCPLVARTPPAGCRRAPLLLFPATPSSYRPTPPTRGPRQRSTCSPSSLVVRIQVAGYHHLPVRSLFRPPIIVLHSYITTVRTELGLALAESGQQLNTPSFVTVRPRGRQHKHH
jgi:hypothetical protein